MADTIDLSTAKRCFGNGRHQARYATYHDTEWGVASVDDDYLFEMLLLESAQAGLSFETVLNKRAGYRRCFYQFDVQRVALMPDDELLALCFNPSIIRHRGKIFSARTNARAFIDIQQQYGQFAHYLWGYVDHQPIINQWQHLADVPTQNKLSQQLASDLKKRGMCFVGPTSCYAYMQAVGLINDHLIGCPSRHV